MGKTDARVSSTCSRRLEILHPTSQSSHVTRVCPLSDQETVTVLLGNDRAFIPNFTNYSTKQTPATSSKAPAQVVWTEQMITAFECLKGTVCKTAALTIPESDYTFIHQTDASGLGIGGVLSVTRDVIVHPAAYFSKQVKSHQKNYSAMELWRPWL